MNRKPWLLIAALLLMSAFAGAACNTVTVADTLYDDNGNLLNGTVTIVNTMVITGADGCVVPAYTSKKATVTAGVLNVGLVPNSGSAPSGSYYTVEYHVSSKYFTEYWTVPASGPQFLSGVRVLLPPTPNALLLRTQLPAVVAFTDTANVFTQNQTAPNFIGNLVGNVSGNVTGNMTGNAATATAFAANAANCGANQYAQGVDASGAAEGCAGPVSALPNVSHKWLNSVTAGGLFTQTQPDFSDFTGSASSAQVPIAQTATALAANPANCTGAQLPNGVNASGVVENCAFPIPGEFIVDGVTYANIHAAVVAAGTTGKVRIPATYGGSDVDPNPNGVQIEDDRRLNAAPNRQRGFINMLTDCGLKGDGTTDDATNANACFALYPGYEFFFPKTKANGTCNYLFNSTLTPTGPGWIVRSGAGGTYSTNFGTHVGGTELCFAPGVTGILMDNVGFSGTVEDISLNGQSGTGSQGTPTLLNLPPVSPIYTRNISAIQRTTQVLTVTVSSNAGEGLTAQVGSLVSIAGVTGDATMNGPCLVSALSNTATNPLTFTCSQQGADSGPFGAVGTVAPYTTGTSTADGIQVCGNFHTIRHVGIANFGRHGINAASNESGCAVQFSDDLIIRDSVISENQGFGIFMRGNDSNAGLMSGNALYYNGVWGAYDSSFLGNTWIANQASYNGISNAVGTAPGTQAISSISRTLSSGISTVSVVLAGADVNIKVGSAVVIAGVTDSSFNTSAGSAFFVTTRTDSTHYTYIQPGAPANASSSGGTSRMAKFSEANLASGLDNGSFKIGVASAVWNQAFLSNYSEGGQACKFGQSVFILFGPNLPGACVPNNGTDWAGMWVQGSVPGFPNAMSSNLRMFTENKDNSFGYNLLFRAGISGGTTRPFGFIFYDNNTNTASWSYQVDPTGTTGGSWIFARGSAGGGGVRRLALFGASGGGMSRIDSESTGAVELNKDANSGTGGLVVCSGGVSPTCPASPVVDSANAHFAAVVKSATANPASAGFERLAKTDAINFRNNANGADVNGVSLNASDQVQCGGSAGCVDSNSNKFGTIIASGTSVLGTTAIPATSCATVVTTVATNTQTSDSIEWAFNAAPGAGYTAGVHVLPYPTSGNVNFLVCNPTAGSQTPAAATLNWKVVR